MIHNLNNGKRSTTHAIKAERGSQEPFPSMKGSGISREIRRDFNNYLHIRRN